MLYPFWGIPQEHLQVALLKRWDEYRDVGSSLFQLTPVSESDIALLPFDWKFALRDPKVRTVAERAAEEADRAGKKIIVFFFDDSEEEIPFDNAFVFRISLQSGARSNEFALPCWIHDYAGTELNGVVPVRPKWTRPVVGFCGFAGYRLTPDESWYRRTRSRVRKIYRRFPPLTVRERAIQRLRKESRIETNLVLRDNFYAGALTKGDPQALEVAQQVFVNNLIASDYILCARGGGNASYRFYESLAMGRIPLFVNTNCVLPYSWKIDYRTYGPIVDEEELDSIGDAVVGFHDRLSAADFSELQRECRNLWAKYLSPLGFFRDFHEHLDRVA